jgi:hypothetical protein
MDLKIIFDALVKAKNEKDVSFVFKKYPSIFENNSNWHPLGDEKNFFGVIENQQASPIAALIEKVTNSIDAILMKRCLEENIDPKSAEAPQSIEKAIERFFPKYKSWDLDTFLREQAENIQIVADGYPKDRNKNTSLMIYDNGEGQHPSKFETTFLSLLKGNKNSIHFVQGKYNMGGSGAIVFCGEKRFQLVASKRFDNTGEFGFTIVRIHPLTKKEQTEYKNTWYEYLKIDNKIPSFSLEKSLEIGLSNRQFSTGSLIKLYSYDLPKGSSSVISKDLNQSINEFLFEPALPIITVDTKERYPKDRNLERPLFGLKRRLEGSGKEYVQEKIWEEYEAEDIGKLNIDCYVFKPKVGEKTVAETKSTLNKEFFKNNMRVMFSINGQVHGSYTTEFISRSLKFNILKDFLLIHVDCTNMEYDFRKELFMASRDRLKHGKETERLRSFLADKLKKSRLKEIHKERRKSIGVESTNTEELVRSLAKNLPKDNELMKLLNQAINLDEKKGSNKQKNNKKRNKKKVEPPFKPERFPSYFRVDSKKKGDTPAIKIPINGEKSIKFDTDVEDNYFSRVEEKGEMTISIVKNRKKDDGEKPKGEEVGIEDIGKILNVDKSSPSKGSIRITLAPSQSVEVGDEISVKVDLSAPGKNFEEILLVKIVEPEKKKIKQKAEDEKINLGLPELKIVSEKHWQNLGSYEMDYSNVVKLDVEGDTLKTVFVNMDSTIFKNFLTNKNNEEQIELAKKRYTSSVYFHVLFLYMVNKKNGYSFGNETDDLDLATYLQNIFDSTYSSFLINFGMENLMSSLGD